MSTSKLAACFLVRFDNRKGYTLKWNRVDDDELKLEGVIEFKCLPSGLHNVKEDIIYFVHGKYVGLAAFQGVDATEEERNARFVSVGILAPPEQIWLYAQALKDLAKQSVQSSDDTAHLEQFWNKRNSSEEAGNKSTADARAFDPAVATSNMLISFGPLLFPTYRALLLRKRVLLISQPPLQPVCNYVHLLTELANASDLLESNNVHIPPPVKPLFTIGVHDLTDLAASAAWQGASQDAEQSGDATAVGWLACTSDELLATKYQLSEYRIRVASLTRSSPWPKMTRTVDAKQEEVVKATNRDLRRWQALRRHLSKTESQIAYVDGEESTNFHEDDENDRSQLLPAEDSTVPSPDRHIAHQNSIVEPLSWSASLNRWSASAQSVLDTELEQQEDQECLEAAIAPDGEATDEVESTTHATFLSRYFRHLTKRVLSTLSNRASGLEESSYRDEAADSDDDDEHAPLMPDSDSNSTVVHITRNDMIAMGLDAYSTRDVAFAKEMVRLYFGREADIEAAGVEVCGLKIC